MARQILEAGELERQRIGQDLHDDLCQHLTGIACLGRVLQQRVRVLLVDDHVVLRQGMAAMINEEPDLRVCGEADGVREAIRVAEQTRPDVALVDLSIREGDGLELIKELKRRLPETRMLVLSMYDESVYAERALRAGASGYVMKAEAATSVMAGIRSILRGEVYVSLNLVSSGELLRYAIEHNRLHGQ